MEFLLPESLMYVPSNFKIPDLHLFSDALIVNYSFGNNFFRLSTDVTDNISINIMSTFSRVTLRQSQDYLLFQYLLLDKLGRKSVYYSIDIHKAILKKSAFRKDKYVQKVNITIMSL